MTLTLERVLLVSPMRTAEQHADEVIANIADHELFNIVTVQTWRRFIAQQVAIAVAEGLEGRSAAAAAVVREARALVNQPWPLTGKTGRLKEAVAAYDCGKLSIVIHVPIIS